MTGGGGCYNQTTYADLYLCIQTADILPEASPSAVRFSISHLLQDIYPDLPDGRRGLGACGTLFETTRANLHRYLAARLVVNTLVCASQNASREGLAASCRAASYADWHVAFAAEGLVHVAHFLKQKEQISMGILQYVWL